MEMNNKSDKEQLRDKLKQLFDEYLDVETQLSAVENGHFRVCIFGSARIDESHPTYKMVMRIAALFSSLGADIVTGGGPGLMAAANAGEKLSEDSDTYSFGLPIILPKKIEPPNNHLDIKSEHRRFSSRLDEFMRLSNAVVVAPGGIGTMLELLYVWQLMQVGLMEPKPLVLLGKKYWGGLLQWMKSTLLENQMVDVEDLEFIKFANTEADVLEHIIPAMERFKQKQKEMGKEETAEHVSAMIETSLKVKQDPKACRQLPGAKD